MSTFVDFAKLKERVKIEDAAQFLGLRMTRSGEALRGPCPACKSSGDRALVVTPGKGVFYCFASRKGGDAISLVAHIRDIPVRDAGQALAQGFGTVPVPRPDNGTVPGPAGTVPVPPEQKAGLNPLTYLQAEHEAVQALGVSPATAEAFGAGYAPKGIMRGRFAVPIHSKDAILLAYVGIAVSKDQQPALLFPNGFRHTVQIFNQHRVEEGDFLYVARGPLDVLLAHENGVTNVVSFFGDITSDALQALSLMLDERQVPSVDLL